MQDFWVFEDDFIGGAIFSAAATENDPWVVAEVAAAGSPTETRLDHGETAGDFAPGVAQLAMDTQAEAQNLSISFGDKLSFDIDKVSAFECRVRLVPQGTLKDSTTTMAWGLTGDRNATIDTIAVAAIFRLADLTAVNTVVVESDDTTANEKNDIATGQSMADNTWHRFKIDFSNGTTDVRFFMSDTNDNMTRVAAGTTFDMSGYTAGLQPLFQIQKASDANSDAMEIDYVKVWGTR